MAQCKITSLMSNTLDQDISHAISQIISRNWSMLLLHRGTFTPTLAELETC